MKNILILLLTLLCATAGAVDKSTNKATGKSVNKTTNKIADKIADKPSIPAGGYAVFVNNRYEILKVKTAQGVLVNEGCNECLAIKSLSKKEAMPSAKHSAMQNPAAQYCGAVGGTNLVAINDHQGEENFCRFSDGSYVNSWDLFYKRFPKE